MKKRLTIGGLLLALLWTGVVQAQVDLSALDRNMAGPKAHMLVLGTKHLRDLPDDFDPASLQPVRDKLAAYKPDIIAIEAIPGQNCYTKKHQPGVDDPDAFSRFCASSDAARAATDLDIQEVLVAVHKTLKDWPQQPSPAQRRHLAALFLAAGGDASAVTQWLQLPKAERHAGDGLNPTLVALLNKHLSRNSLSHSRSFFHGEFYLIAAHLAARLGLQRVYPIDNHTGDKLDITDVKAYAHDLRQAWNSTKAVRSLVQKHLQTMVKHGHMLALYRYINRPDILQRIADSDIGAAMREASPPRYYSQMYVTGWETRNLRMASNILATIRDHPGARVLVIVGASHKPLLDSLLGHMQGVEIVDAEKVLQ